MGRMILMIAVVCLVTLMLEYALAAWIEKREAIFAISKKVKIAAAAGNVALALFAIYKESTGSYSALWCFGLWSWLFGLVIYDLKLRELPDCWHLIAILFYLLTLLSDTQPGSWKSSLLVVIVLASVLGLVYCIRNNAIGIGDIKLLWKMVRSLAGTMMNLARLDASPVAFKKILESRNRKNAGPTAPPTGLFLYKVNFDGVRRH